MEKMKKLLLVSLIIALVSACAHNGGQGASSEQGIWIESPYFKAQISIDGDVVGTTPLVVPYSQIRHRTLNVTAVSVDDDTYRQELIFTVPPLPDKIVVLALHGPTAPAPQAQAASTADEPLQTPECSEETECSPEPIFTPTIFFDTDKSDVSNQAMEALRVFCDIMKNNSYGMDIVGFADERHSVAYNLKLSLRRARAVSEALQSLGLSVDRMHLEGRGEIQSVNDQGRKMEWSHNRRVEIRIVQ